MIISDDWTDTIKTYALASCIGIVAHSYDKKVGGILHIALPYPAKKENGEVKCYYYASTGLPLFINQMCQNYGCYKGELTISLFGGADSINKNDTFQVGRRNLEAVGNILDEMNIKVSGMEVGAQVSRTITLEVSTGKIHISRQKIII